MVDIMIKDNKGKAQRIKELEAEVKDLKDTIKHQKSWIDELYEMAYM